MTTNVCRSVCLSVCLCVEKNEIQSFYWMFVENTQVSPLDRLTSWLYAKGSQNIYHNTDLIFTDS